MSLALAGRFFTTSATWQAPVVHFTYVQFTVCQLYLKQVSLVAEMAKNLPAMQVTQVLSVGQEDLLEKGMATHSSILVWRILWTEEPGRLQYKGYKELDMTE